MKRAAKSKVSGQAVLSTKDLKMFVKEARRVRSFPRLSNFRTVVRGEKNETMSLNMRFKCTTSSSEEEDVKEEEMLRTLRVRVSDMRWNRVFDLV